MLHGLNPFFEVSVSKRIFSNAPKISKDLLVIRIPRSPDIGLAPKLSKDLMSDENAMIT